MTFAYVPDAAEGLRFSVTRLRAAEASEEIADLA